MIGLLDLLDAPSPRGLADLGGQWDQALMVGCRHFALLDDAEKGTIRRAIDRDRSWVLISWAEGLASLGVRAGSRDILVFGLIGLSLFDDAAVDTRDAEVVYSLLVRAARKIGENPSSLAQEAARQTDARGAAWLLGHEPDPDVVLPPTHYEDGEGDEFAFRRRAADRDPEVELADFLDDA